MADPAAVLYRSIDWTRCFVMGSSVLKRFTGASFEPGDIDVVCKIADSEDYERLLAEFILRTSHLNSSMEQEITTPIVSLEEVVRNEDFAPTMRCTTLKVPGVNIPVQLIGMRADTRDFASHVGNTCELPSNLMYTCREGIDSCFFIVPERTAECLQTRVIPAKDIQAHRRAKYEKRGFKIVE